MLVAQVCLTLCVSIECRPPGFFAHRILKARILKWVAFPLSRFFLVVYCLLFVCSHSSYFSSDNWFLALCHCVGKKKKLNIISILLFFIETYFCDLLCHLSWGLFHIHLLKIFFLMILDGVSCGYLSHLSGLMCHLRTLFPYFLTDSLSGWSFQWCNWMLKFPTIIVLSYNNTILCLLKFSYIYVYIYI